MNIFTPQGLFPTRRLREVHAKCVAFTLIELLVVIAIIGILASLLLPVLAKGKLKAAGVKCMSNMKQLQLGWHLYADDNEGKLVHNRNWVLGDASLASITGGKLWPYIDDATIYKCPGDKKDTGKARSVCMNGYMGCWTDGGAAWFQTGWPRPGAFEIYKLIEEVSTPSGTFVMVDEHEKTLQDGFFRTDCYTTYANITVSDFPATYHNDASAFSFVDGHVEIHKWVSTFFTDTPPPGNWKAPAPNNPDVIWLMQRSTNPTGGVAWP